MTKIIIVKITCCDECPNHHCYDDNESVLGTWCGITDKRIIDIKTIPKWCPLEGEDKK